MGRIMNTLHAVLALLVAGVLFAVPLGTSAHPPGYHDAEARSNAVADYDDDDDEPIYWEHDDDEGGPWAEAVFSDREKQLIRNFYNSNHPSIHERRDPPPWLKEEAFTGGILPADWASRVQRLRVIPTDVYAGAMAIPPELLRRLPPQPAGTHLLEVGNRIVRIYNETRAVADYVQL